MLLSVLLLFVSDRALAKEFLYYQLPAFTCELSTGTSLAYDAAETPNLVKSRKGVFRKNFYFDGARFDGELDRSELAFTGHRPTAGPSVDFWESDYVIHFPGRLPENAEADAAGVVWQRTYFSDWFKIGTASCRLTLGNLW